MIIRSCTWKAILFGSGKGYGIAKSIVYNTAKNIVNGKDRETIEKRLKEEEYYIVDILSEKWTIRLWN